MSDLEALLRKTLEERRKKSLSAVEDLKAIVADMTSAVRGVTKGRLSIGLDPLPAKDGSGPTFVLALRLPDEERDLRVIAFSERGYPARVWSSYAKWDSDSAAGSYPLATADNLRISLEHLLSDPQSELVRIIENQLAVMPDEAGALAGSAAG